MLVLETISEMHSQVAALKASGKVLSFVPTMGALHQGHLSLVEIAKLHGNYSIASIFVNPAQFNSKEDLARYPRTVDRDLSALRAAGVDLVFLPSEAEMYPAGGTKDYGVYILAGRAKEGLCGATRPGHFDGVVTVVSMLFHIVQPDIAVFGLKDYQQCRVISELVKQQHFPVELVYGPTVRDEDGLALSSRNQLLSVAERIEARKIPEALFAAERLCREEGEHATEKIKNFVRGKLSESAMIRPDYVEICDSETLAPLLIVDREAQLLIAAFVNNVRLIDNIRLSAAS